MPVSVNKNLAASYILEDPLGRIANDGRVSNLGRVGKKGYVDSRLAVNFDGVDDYGVLANRAINPDGDIEVEWEQIGVLASGVCAIVAQSNSGTFSQRELNLRWVTNLLSLSVGGSDVILSTDGITNTSGKYRLTYTGTTITVFRNGLQIFTNPSRPRGAAREPAAPTRIGVRSSGGSLVDFFAGILFNIRINGVLWAMDQRNQAIQPSTPAGNNMTLVNVTSDRWQEVPQ